MKEVGMEDCSNIGDDITTASISSCSSSSISTFSHDPDVFPIMELPVEIRCKILNMLGQRQVPNLRLVGRQWKNEIDQFYEFSLNVYDTTTNFHLIKNVRCKECTIWKLTKPLIDPPSLFLHPAYLKIMKIYGPTSAQNLKNLIAASTNLEQLILTRRANYPWFLNLKDTPALGNLGELKYLRLNSEEQVFMHKNKDSVSSPRCPPMMDCFFPKLKHFEILKRFAVWQYSHYVTEILKFVARHVKTLRTLELDLIPLSCCAILDESSSDSEEEEELGGAARERILSGMSPELISLAELCKLNLTKFCVTTKGADCDIFIWKSILEKQSNLKELRFDWLCKDSKAEIRARQDQAGFPWIHFQAPIQQSSEHLVHLELANLSMFCPGSNRVVPFDLGIFRNCSRLKSLVLRCRENHGKLPAAQVDEMNPPQPPPYGIGGSSEVLLLINGSDVPSSLEQLEIFRFPMLTSDISAMISKLTNIRKLFLHECGKTGGYGVNADIIKCMGSLETLKFLEVIGFNDSDGDKRAELEQVFQSLGIPYEGRDSWLEFSNGSSSAHDSLKILLT